MNVNPLGFIHITWLPGSTSSLAMRAAFEQLLCQLQRSGWSKVLIDQRRMAAPLDEDTTWYLLDWLPRAAHKGYRYGAILSPIPVFGRLATHSIAREAMQQFPLIYQHFEQEQPAADWLLAQR